MYPESGVYRKKVNPISNVFAHNPRRVIKPAKHQTGEEPKKNIGEEKSLSPGKRISKTGKTYYEYRRNRSDALGKTV